MSGRAESKRSLSARLLLLLLFFLFFESARGQAVWTDDFVHTTGSDFSYSCPEGTVLLGLASEYRTSQYDRQWQYQCGPASNLANVSISCTTQSAVNTPQNDIQFSCPNGGYLGGVASQFFADSSDRVWQPVCCTRPFSALIDCDQPTAGWENNFRDTLNFTAPEGHVIAGITSSYFNRDRRWRFDTCSVQVNCTDPGTPANSVRVGDNFLFGDVITYTCNHGYYQSDGPEGGVRMCLETGLWSETEPVCTACTDIPDCTDIRCSNTTDQLCHECASDNGPGQTGFRNLGTECEPLCSWLQGLCYPGSCPDGISSCNCSSGFTGPDCLNITEPPTLQTCSITIQEYLGNELQVDCLTNSSSSSSSAHYTNILPQELLVDWSAMFPSPSLLPSQPAYIDGFSVGVAEAEVYTSLVRAANPTSVVSMETHPCIDPAPSRDAPLSLPQCTAVANFSSSSSHLFFHADIFLVEAVSRSGGYLDVTDLDTLVVSRFHYTPASTVGAATFILDLQPPTHCSLSSSSSPCLVGQSLLDVGAELTTDTEVRVQWGGWTDTPAGLVNYRLHVYRLSESSGLLREGTVVAMTTVDHTPRQLGYEFMVNISDGSFSAVLQAWDTAGNVQLSRRLWLVDTSSQLLVSNTSTAALRLVTGVPATNYLWINSTSSALIFTGPAHFYNTLFLQQDQLAPVANFSPAILPTYDHPLVSGAYPRSGIPNALGVTELHYQVVIDQEGGRAPDSLTEPAVFPRQTDDLTLTAVEVEMEEELKDGDSVRVWFQATDYLSHTAVDSLLFHVDSSPPQLDHLWLEWNGVTGLVLHGTETLTDLNIQFQTSDPHSGVFQIQYWIGTAPGTSDVAQGSVPVQEVPSTNCSQPTCVCTSLLTCSLLQYSFSPLSSDFTDSNSTLHDTDYFITVMVTNHARLYTSLSLQITTDVTPPLSGVVIDATPGSHDLDYQQSHTLLAWWGDFFDPETSILTYQYIFDDKCANSSLFSFPLPSGGDVTETVYTNASWVVSNAGTYYVTVVAFNHALQPSLPACSDGVTVDFVAPWFSGVEVPGVRVEGGLVRSGDGDVWVIGEGRERWRVRGGEEVGECVNQSTTIFDLSQFPISSSSNGEQDPSICSLLSPFSSSSPTFLSSDHALNISWSATDNESPITFLVAAVSSDDYLRGDELNFTSSAGHAHFSISDPLLLMEGATFFVVIRATDIAGNRVEVVVGPVLVDVTPSVINGSLDVVQDISGDHVTVMWSEAVFSDEESLVDSLQYSVGTSEYGSQLLPFTPLPPTLTPPCLTPHCLTLTSSSSLPLLSGQTYYITIRATNYAGLTNHISASFAYVYGPPSEGAVFDLDPRTSNSSDPLTSDPSDPCTDLWDSDVDLLLNSDRPAARWTGFSHTHLSVTFSVGLGSIPGADDLVPFTGVNTSQYHIFTTVTLTPYQMYYVTVVAEGEGGSTSASSDGAMFLPAVGERLQGAVVADGYGAEDSDYQFSTSSLASSWSFPSSLLPHLSHYRWGLFRKTSELLIEIRPFENVGLQSRVVWAGLSLEEEEEYVSAVQACLASPAPSCLAPVYSDGIQILIHPTANPLTAVFEPLDWTVGAGGSEYGRLQLSWAPFQDPQMAYYEWAIGTGVVAHELVTSWSQVDWYRTSVSVLLNTSLSLYHTNTVTLRGYNAAGLYSTTSATLEWTVDGMTLPQDEVPRPQLVVYDIPDSAVLAEPGMDWRQLEYMEWDPVDQELDYTNSSRSMSAAWPDLRYTLYQYSVSATPTFQSCDSGLAVACGSTIANSLTITNLDLQDGQRYYVCVQALEEDAIHSSPITPHTLTACSNGITVDLTPPLDSCVQLRPLTFEDDAELSSGGGASGSGYSVSVPFQDNSCSSNGSSFQSSSSDLHLIWSPFQDLEWYGDTVHTSGVVYYEYAIGSTPGEWDVVPLTSVGVASQMTITGLTLQHAHTYYATVRAHDLTGQWSEVVSQGLTVDLTPPTGPTHFSLADSAGFYSMLPPVLDAESGVTGIELGLGSSPGASDLMEWTMVTYQNGLETYIHQAGIRDGQTVFASLLVWNGAGLFTLISSLGHTHDTSPPITGIVYDTQPDTNISALCCHDDDYTSSVTDVAAEWSGFVDPHTPLVGYHWAIGTCPSCDNVQSFVSVGMATAAKRSGLSLSSGLTYYVSVQACNSAGLCCQATSNGITVDATPPIPGLVVYGPVGQDLKYSSSRSHIAVHWNGFHDNESSLKHLTISAGLWLGDDSLLPSTMLPPSSSSLTLTLSSPLPLLTPIFTRVTAFNNAGLSSSSDSSSLLVDISSPSLLNTSINVDWAGSVVMATQYTSTALRVSWDSPASALFHFWSLVPDSGAAVLLGPQTSIQPYGQTITAISLSDGSLLHVEVVSCSAAHICSGAESAAILVDSSPPVGGAFAAATSSALGQSWSVPGGLTWRNRLRGDARLNLAFYGFSDVHSNIMSYWAAVGSRYGQDDLTEGPVELSATLASEEGTWFAVVGLSHQLQIDSVIFISLWAVNGVGLESERVQGSFLVEEVEGRTNNGSFFLQRSSLCSLESCLGHCSCAIPEAAGLEPGSTVSVFHVSPQQEGGGTQLFTAATDKLIGRWEEPDPSPFQRLEWTVGRAGGLPGDGVFDTINDQIWSEATGSSETIFSVNPNIPLEDGTSYVFYARSWFNFTHYIVFESVGITVDAAGPAVGKGVRVREGGWGGLLDVDYLGNTTHIQLLWDGTFLDTPSSTHSTYTMGIGDIPGIDNAVPFVSVSNTGSTIAVASDPLEHGRQYYSTLRATSPLGVTFESVSDGFTVDITPPEVGVVWDGLQSWDMSAQSYTHSLSARWTGFHDAESGIHHYELAFSDSLSPPLESEYGDMGIRLRGTLTGLSLTPGQTYYVHVLAVNNAGLKSASVPSSGIVVDTSRPGYTQCTWQPLSIPSLDPFLTQYSPCPTDTPVEEGAVNGSQASFFPSFASSHPLIGCYFLSFTGTHYLSIPSSPGSLYSLSLWLAQAPDNGCGHLTPLLARVQTPGLDQTLSLQTWNGDSLFRWSQFQFQFTAEDVTSDLTLSTLSDQYALAVDRIEISECVSSFNSTFNDIISNDSSVFQVSQEHLSSSRSQFHACWAVWDGDSGVSEFQWAVGTVPGGEQLQQYTSTGSANCDVSKELPVFHSQELYISVVAWNGAGEETVVYGGPYVVDFTGPELEGGGGGGGGVWDGVGEDVDYQNSTMLASDWSSFMDPESGLLECGWSLGTIPGSSDLHRYTPSSLTTTSILTLPHLVHGTTSFTTVTCTNTAGLVSTATSDGVTILLTPPTSDSAYLAVSSPLLTVYPSRQSVVPSGNITLRWGGFTEPAGTPLSYEVCVRGEECLEVGEGRQVMVRGVDGEGEMEVSIVAINRAGLRSIPLEGNLYIQPDPPIDTGIPINATWQGDSIMFDWTNKFQTTPTLPLYFDLSLGPLVGSGSVHKWVELTTDQTTLLVLDSRIDGQTNYFLSLVAISASGLHTIAGTMVPALP